MLDNFDIIALPEGGYQLVSGWSFIKIDFDNDVERSMFGVIVDQRGKSPSAIIKALLKIADRDRVFAFFDKLRQSRLIHFESGQALFEGKVGDTTPLQDQIDQIRDRRIAVLGRGSLSEQLCRLKNFSGINVVEPDTIRDSASLAGFIDHHEFIIVDGARMAPGALLAFNRAALAASKPWMLAQGVFDSAGHVGPIFCGGDTGCFHCFYTRLRSNAGARLAFDRYAAWLDENGAAPVAVSLPSEAYMAFMASIVALEAEKFLAEYDITQSYGYLLDINFRDYAVKAHRLYKVPFCETCGGEFEHRTAPWLESISLAVA